LDLLAFDFLFGGEREGDGKPHEQNREREMNWEGRTWEKEGKVNRKGPEKREVETE
jgi:hypothetical protein